MSRRGILITLRARDERGAVAVLVALLLVVMFTIVALVVDIAAMRADARTSQATGDFAAMAGALSLEPTNGANPFGACVAAYQYFIANTRGGISNPPAPATACSRFANITFCSESTPQTSAEIDVGPYHVTITTPVDDGPGLMRGRSDPAVDGNRCQRIAVQVRRTRAFLFGAIARNAQGVTEPPAVARATAGTTTDGFASLVVLDPFGCKALLASGQGRVWVRPTSTHPGLITVDSNASYRGTPTERSCAQASQDFTIDAVGTQNSKIQAGGVSKDDCSVTNGLITDFALLPGNATNQAYEEIDVSGCRLVPRPIAGFRITRAPIDHRYNCKSSYPTYFGISIAPCKDAATTAPYIDNLRTAIGTTGVPPGFTTIPTTYIPASCATQPSTPAVVVPAGNWYVPCAQLDLNSQLLFEPGSNIVFEGSVNIGSFTGQLCVNVSACDEPQTIPGSYDGYIYFRRGDREGNENVGNFEKDAFATINLKRSMVYLDFGRIDLNAGSGKLFWTAPTDGLFEDLALWSERATQHLLGGQANLEIAGTFFTPFASPFRYSGQGDQYQPNAQFVTFRMEVTGLGTLVMEPDPERTTPVPLTGVLLIR